MCMHLRETCKMKKKISAKTFFALFKTEHKNSRLLKCLKKMFFFKTALKWLEDRQHIKEHKRNLVAFLHILPKSVRTQIKLRLVSLILPHRKLNPL